jgi:glycosyltransferase involved in cell wall biosynthesis
MIYLSIVSGTFNRLKYVSQMVESVRRSIGVGLKYEVVLVDGGSTDGTIEWAKKQQDIHLIKHGKLLGAVKAFNDGAYAAKGKYVILANDDVEFLCDSLLRAYSYMEDHLAVGIGCFYQDRGGRDWHLEYMPVVDLQGRRTSAIYGQVCIVRKWLGDKVGWWGNYLKTYGGDNELSCNVYEYGYDIEPIPCGFIHDLRVEDELRNINNVETGTNPDSAAWTKKWLEDGRHGPIIRKTRPAHFQKDIRVLYAPVYEQDNKLQRQTKKGLRDALAKGCAVLEVDYLSIDRLDFMDLADAFNPHIFLLQIQDTRYFSRDMITVMKRYFPHAKYISWNGDYRPEVFSDKDYMSVMKEMHLATFAIASIKDYYTANGIKYKYWQIGYEPTSLKGTQLARHHDVVFLANCYSQARYELGSRLLRMDAGRRIDVGLYGNWPTGWAQGVNLYDFEHGAQLYRAAKLAISDQQWPRAQGYVSNRLFQALAAGGCLVLQQHFDGMEEYLGLEDNVHLRVWHNLDELENLVRHYVQDDAKVIFEREDIASAGTEYTRDWHSFDRRVNELMGWIVPTLRL